MKRSFTVPTKLFTTPGWSRIPPLEKGFLLALYGECDGYGILPVIKAGRVSELDQLGWDAIMEILFELNKRNLIRIYEVDQEEYLQLIDYDSHLSSVQVNRRSTLWPHPDNMMSTQSQHDADKMLTRRRTPNSQPTGQQNHPKGVITGQDVQSISINKKTSNNKDLTNKEKSNNCKSRAKKWNTDEEFGEFWRSYYSMAKAFGANAGSKKEAYQAYKQADASLSDIMEGLVKWAKSKDWADGRIRHACRWLKAEMWNDDPVPVNPEGNKAHYQPVDKSPVILTEDDIPF